MSTLKISKHSDVPAALDLVKEEVDKEAKRINEAGAVAAISGGWFVKTHSGTASKILYVKRIGKALKLKLTVKGT